jgi:hypothetical protein
VILMILQTILWVLVGLSLLDSTIATFYLRRRSHRGLQCPDKIRTALLKRGALKKSLTPDEGVELETAYLKNEASFGLRLGVIGLACACACAFIVELPGLAAGFIMVMASLGILLALLGLVCQIPFISRGY